MYCKRAMSTTVFIVFVLCLQGVGVSAPSVVYDNTSTPTAGPWTPGGFLAFNFYFPDEPMGDEMDLNGTERVVTEFQMLLSSSQPTVLSSLTLTFRENDAFVMGGYPFGPGTEIWSTTRSGIAVDGPTTVTFSVPDIVVPDRFTWLASADSDVAGMATFDPPTVGTSADYFWDLDSNDGEWYALTLQDQVSNLGARVLAVPEPACAGLLAVGFLALARKRRR